MHNRTKLRNATQAKLLADAAVTGLVDSKYIFNSRILQLPKSAKKAISIYTFDETGAKTESEDDLIRIQNLMIVVWVSGKDGATLNTGEKSAEETLDEILKAIEDLFFNKYENLRDFWPTGERPPYRVNYTNTKIQQDAMSETIILIATMKFDVEFHQGLPQLP